jgi:HD-GYP domain-containing protein (c-di-GMP phosphodiesterase class II)
VRGLASLADSRLPGSLQHGARVGRRARAIALRLDLGADFATHALLAGILHDVGIALLVPPGGWPPGSPQTRLLWQHPIKSAELIAGASALAPVVPFIVQHHELLDGSGYPGRLFGTGISMAGRVMAAAEQYEEELLASVAGGPADALATVARAAGRTLDGDVVAALRLSVVADDLA